MCLSFQFHIGAIRSALTAALVGLITSFNSILVQLEVPVNQPFYTASACFNSILVQLEGCSTSVLRAVRSRFNSILVQLEAF